MPFTILRLFDLDSEANLPTWFSALDLMVCAVLLAVIARSEWTRNRRFAMQWAGLAVIFVGLSLDETAKLHETLTNVSREAFDTTGGLVSAWVIPGMAFTAVFVLAYLNFLLKLPLRHAASFVLSGVVFVGGSIGMEIVSWHHLYPSFMAHGWEHGRDFTYSVLNHIEELMEMTGIALFVRTLLTYLRDRGISLTLGVTAG